MIVNNREIEYVYDVTAFLVRSGQLSSVRLAAVTSLRNKLQSSALASKTKKSVELVDKYRKDGKKDEKFDPDKLPLYKADVITQNNTQIDLTTLVKEEESLFESLVYIKILSGQEDFAQF